MKRSEKYRGSFTSSTRPLPTLTYQVPTTSTNNSAFNCVCSRNGLEIVRIELGTGQFRKLAIPNSGLLQQQPRRQNVVR